MSHQAVSEIIGPPPRAYGADLLVAIVVAERADEHGQNSWASNEDIARRANLARFGELAEPPPDAPCDEQAEYRRRRANALRSAKRSLRNLQQAGVLEDTGVTAFGTRNYRTLPRPDTVSASDTVSGASAKSGSPADTVSVKADERSGRPDTVSAKADTMSPKPSGNHPDEPSGNHGSDADASDVSDLLEKKEELQRPEVTELLGSGETSEPFDPERRALLAQLRDDHLSVDERQRIFQRLRELDGEEITIDVWARRLPALLEAVPA